MLGNRKDRGSVSLGSLGILQAVVEGKAVFTTARKTDRNQERLPRAPVTDAGLWYARIA